MKKYIIALTFFFGLLGFVNAQTSPVVKKETKKEKKEKVSDVQTSTTTKGMKKDGTPDMRLKANKIKVQAAPQVQANTQSQPTPKVQPVTPMQTQTVTQPRVRKQAQPVPPQVIQEKTQVSTSTTKSADKVIETDAKGRTIYQGPKGGKYYVNKNGNKEYIK